MKTNGKLFLLTIAMLVQSYSIVQMFQPVYHHWPAPFFFLLGVEPETIYIVLLMWYVVFVSLFLLFGKRLRKSARLWEVYADS